MSLPQSPNGTNSVWGWGWGWGCLPGDIPCTLWWAKLVLGWLRCYVIFGVFFNFNDFSRFYHFKKPKKTKQIGKSQKTKQSSDDVTTIKTPKLAAYNITINDGSKSMRRHFIAAAEARSLRWYIMMTSFLAILGVMWLLPILRYFFAFFAIFYDFKQFSLFLPSLHVLAKLNSYSPH